MALGEIGTTDINSGIARMCFMIKWGGGDSVGITEGGGVEKNQRTLQGFQEEEGQGRGADRGD